MLSTDSMPSIRETPLVWWRIVDLYLPAGLTSQCPVNLLLTVSTAHFVCLNVVMFFLMRMLLVEMIFTIVSLCSTNENGSLCYKLYVENAVVFNSAYSCSTTPEDCDCLQLSEGVAEQGCCINVIHDFYKSRNMFDPLDEVYSDCNVTLPGTGCNNGPLRNSSLLPGESTRPPTSPPAGGDCVPQASLFAVLLSIAFVLTTMTL